MIQFSLLVSLLLVKETMTIARPSFASNTTEKPPVVVPFGRRAPASAKTSVNACDTEIHTKNSRVFFCAVDEQKKEKMKEKKTLKSLAFVRSNKHTCDIHKQSNLSLSFFFRANGEEKKVRE